MKQLFFAIFFLLILNTTYAQVKATSAEINTGTDDDKFATALALQGSKYLDQNGAKISAVTSAGANTYIASITPAITGYISGQVFYIKITTANTGASTLNLNGLGAKALVKDVSTPLVTGDLLANKVYAVYYDGVNFQITNIAASNVAPSQTLSLGTASGNVIISGGNNVTLSTLALSNNTDANTQSLVGFSTYINTTGSLNFPSATGAGIRVNRTGTTSTLGQFEFWKDASNSSYLFFRTGSGTSTFNPWKVIADRDWVNLEFSRRGLGTSAGINSIRVSDTRAVNNLPSELNLTSSFDFKSVSTLGLPLQSGFAATTTFVPYIDLSGNKSAAYRMAHSAGNLYFQNIVSQSEWGTWKTIADRDWSTANFAPLTGGAYLPLTGGIIQSGVANKLILKKTAPGQANYIQFQDDTGTSTGYVGHGGASNDIALVSGLGNISLYANGGTRVSVTGTVVNFSVPITGTSAAFSSTVKTIGTVISNTSATTRALSYQTDNVNRWLIYTDKIAETGSNAGSNFNISRYSDDGTYLSNALIINRASGNAIFSNTVTAPTFIGALTGNATTASAVAWTGITAKPTTLTGYGITDAATQASLATIDANAVHKTGNETIAGVKLFSTSVGIGTTNLHSYKLAVGGGIIAESVKVKPQAQWPDYVFEKDYPILGLNELEKFVLKNKHLPNVPNANEVKKDGIELGEMNAKLLQKIEELTLYIIDQQKNIVNQQLSIKKQEASIKAQQLEITDLKGKVNEVSKLSELVEKLGREMNLLKNK